ncbi:MAG: OB-fold protein [Chitinophagaceae bacterium]
MKRVLWSIFALVVIAAGIYWYVATEKFADTNDREAAYTVNALDFIREFHEGDSAANAKYRDKIITVNGTVSAVEPADSATMNIKFIDTTTGSYVIFAFQEQHVAEAKTIKEGDIVSIKGSCSGGTYSEILGVEKIDFKRSALNKTK